MLWAIILAGGEGKRLAWYTRQLTGRAIPKQFCRVVGTSSLLEQTLRRVSRSVDRRHTLIALTRSHEGFYLPLLRDFPPDNLVVQPENRDTAPAILYSLLRIARKDPEATVTLFPSDHYVGDDGVLMDHVKLAAEAVHLRPHPIAVLGIPATSPETGYGWIEPDKHGASPRAAIYPVKRFWEKPSPVLAKDLLRQGCLWNSFVMIARIPAFIDLFRSELPELYGSFGTVTQAFGSGYESSIVERLYGNLSSTNFSARVLEKTAHKLSVVPVSGLEWSDLGTARRLLETITRVQRRARHLA